MANNNVTTAAGWFLAGLGLGALVGVLYAPKAGSETREDLLQAGIDAKDKATALAQQSLTKANEYVAQGKQTAAAYVDQGKDALDKGKKQWDAYVEKGKTLVQSQQDAVQAAIDAGKEAYLAKTEETAA